VLPGASSGRAGWGPRAGEQAPPVGSKVERGSEGSSASKQTSSQSVVSSTQAWDEGLSLRVPDMEIRRLVQAALVGPAHDLELLVGAVVEPVEVQRARSGSATSTQTYESTRAGPIGATGV
jgi:hypothetical protein